MDVIGGIHLLALYEEGNFEVLTTVKFLSVFFPQGVPLSFSSCGSPLVVGSLIPRGVWGSREGRGFRPAGFQSCSEPQLGATLA